MYNRSAIIFVSVWRKSITFDEDMREKRFLHLNSYNLWPLDLNFAPLVILVQRFFA